MSEKLTDEQVEEILAGCEYVTPGPWNATAITQGTGDYCIHAQGIPWQLAYLAENSQVEWPIEANAAHIARLDPQTVASLATELLALRKRVGELERTPANEFDAMFFAVEAVMSSPQLAAEALDNMVKLTEIALSTFRERLRQAAALHTPKEPS